MDNRLRPIGPKYVSEHYTKKEVMIPMRDSVSLFTSIYLPREGGNYPVIMVRSPYGVGPYGKSLSPDLYRIYYEFVRNNYILVFQNVRGTYLSEGTYENIRPVGRDCVDDATDTYDTVEWIIGNLPTNGCVGVKGISYPGFYATVAGLCGHPSIKAISPQAPVTDWFKGDDTHLGGAFQMGMYFFASSFMRPRRKPTIRFPRGLYSPEGDIYDYFLEREPLSDLFSTIEDKVDFIPEMLKHPTYDSFWEERNPALRLASCKVPTLVVGGWYDGEDAYGSFETFRKLKELSPDTPSYLVAGPWYHGGWKKTSYDHLGDVYFGKGSARYFLEKIEYPFFAYYLEGKGDKPHYEAAVLPSSRTSKQEMENYRIGDNDWEWLSCWPPKAEGRRMYLSAKETLSTNPPGKDVSFTYTSDPAHPVPYCSETTLVISRDAQVGNQKFARRRTDVLSFASRKLTSPLKVEGRVKVDFKVLSTGGDADIIVKLVDIRPDGYCMLVRLGVLPLRFRNGMHKAEKVVEGEAMDISFELTDLGHIFESGHRVMVQVQSSFFPFISMNPQTFLENPYRATEDDYRKCDITILSGSFVELPVVE